MEGINQVFVKGLGSILLFVFLTSCASVPELKVHYQLPPPSDDLKGQKVYLALQDGRKTKEIFGARGKQEFGSFTGQISFSLARYNESGFKIGPFELTAMVKEGFKRRLETAGMEVLSSQSHGEPQLLIILNEFLLDRVDRKWVAKMGYEARLMKDGETLSKQVISGEAERVKMLGRGEASTVAGELFTDMLNRVNLLRLFQQANLIG